MSTPMRNEQHLIRAVNREADRALRHRPFEKSAGKVVAELQAEFPDYPEVEIRELLLDAWQERGLFWRA